MERVSEDWKKTKEAIEKGERTDWKDHDAWLTYHGYKKGGGSVRKKMAPMKTYAMNRGGKVAPLRKPRRV